MEIPLVDMCKMLHLNAQIHLVLNRYDVQHIGVGRIQNVWNILFQLIRQSPLSI